MGTGCSAVGTPGDVGRSRLGSCSLVASPGEAGRCAAPELWLVFMIGPLRPRGRAWKILMTQHLQRPTPWAL